MIAVAAASGAMAMVPAAHADSTADGTVAGSPGVGSGNGIQLPVAVPVNVCGNSVDVVGLLNPAFGNSCATKGGSGHKSGGASAEQVTKDSPGVISGNGVQLPVDLPVNVSGNTANIVGIDNPVFGNESSNTSGERPEEPTEPRTPPARPSEPVDNTVPPVHAEPPAPDHEPALVRTPVREETAVGTLAETGSDGLFPAAMASGALLLGGAALYRRYRPGAEG
ncbi:hypothetical protein C3489_16505 [Streptomyces sp. Ru71]|nr:hypothetical protein C3489_16505 [Streptomyces sp. Ru71]